MSNLGHYRVGQTKYPSYQKVQACKDATTRKLPITFTFYDEVWDSLVLRPPPSIPLDALYTLRAQQLRNKYSWVTLNYSGGSDSHNILMTFLNNKIHLDEVLVKWSKVPKDRNWYSPTRLTGTAKDSLAEWDYAIKPTLDWLAKEHPEIKVTVIDYMEDFLSIDNNVDSVLAKLDSIGLSRGVLGSYVQRASPKVEEHVLASKKFACSVFGVEKPVLERRGSKLYFKFTDVGTETAVLQHEDLRATTELFYWSPDLPELAYSQAIEAAIFVTKHPKLNPLLESSNELPVVALSVNEMHTALKSVLYKKTWTPKFQAPKPNVSRSDWWWWLHESPDLFDLRRSFDRATHELYSGIRKSLVFHQNTSSFLQPLATKPFYLMDVL